MVHDCVCDGCLVPSYYILPVTDGRRLCRACTSKYKYPHWPRGKHNGMRIVGFQVKVSIRVDDWLWKPMIGHYCGAFHWLFWRSWFSAEYEY